MIKGKLLVGGLIIGSLLFASCNQVQSLKNHFFKSSKKEKSESTPVNKKAPVEDTVIPEKLAEDINDNNTSDPAPSNPEPTAAEPAQPPPAPVKEEGPVIPVDHWGGTPTAFKAGQQNLYVGLGRKLVWYDLNFNPKGSIELDAAIQELFLDEQAGFVYVKETGNILEIVRLSKDQAPPSIVKSFQVDGNFDVLFPSPGAQLAVYLADKIQLLNLTDLNSTSIIAEIPQNQISQVFLFDDYLYLVQNTVLHRLQRSTLEIKSSLPLGIHFKILGIQSFQDVPHLLLALKAPQSELFKAIHRIPLNKKDGSFLKMGESVELKSGAKNIILDHKKPNAYLVKEEGLAFADLEKKQEFDLTISFTDPIEAIEVDHSVVTLATRLNLFRYELVSPVPASFYLGQEQKLALPGQINLLQLPFENSMYLFSADSETDANHAPVFIIKDISDKKAQSFPIWTNPPKQVRFNQAQLTRLGLFIKDDLANQLFLISKDKPTSLEPITLEFGKSEGLDATKNEKGNYLYLTGQGEIAVFNIGADGIIKKEAGLPLAQETFGLKIVPKGIKAIVACGVKGVCIVDLATKHPQMQITTIVVPTHKESKATEIILSPNGRFAYVLYEKPDGNIIAIIDLNLPNPAEIATLTNVELSREQFRGATFSAGGQKLLLPLEQGLALYDVKSPRKPSQIGIWSVGKVWFADITDQGKKVCVALGEQGVECGQVK